MSGLITDIGAMPGMPGVRQVQVAPVYPVAFPTRAYNDSTLVYVVGGEIAKMDGLFAFMFTNLGDDTAWVNGKVIFPSATPGTALGDSRTISGHLGDLYKGNITLKFAGVGVAPSVEICQLFYVL